MNPSKSNPNNGYNNYKQPGRNMMPYDDPAYGNLTTNDKQFGHDAGYLNHSMGFGMGLGDSSGATGFENMIPPNDKNMNYYQEYCRLFIANVVLTTQMKELISEKNELLTRLSELERGGGGGEKFTRELSTSEAAADKKSRLRRKATEIERHYQCPNNVCQKKYGSEGSLIQHVKLKHPELTEDPDWKMKILGKTEESEGAANE